MHKSDIVAVAITILFVLGLVLLRLLGLGTQLAAAAGLGRFPRFPQRLQRWLFGDRKQAPAGQRN